LAEPTSTIRADFDRIALISQEGWNHNTHYHGFLLRQIPAHLDEALDLGCGTGRFARLLAQRAERVLGLDLSPQMIRVAGERSMGYQNITFEAADATTWVFGRERFDCIASIATLHHLPLAQTLTKLRDALQPNGTLLVLDLYQSQGLPDLLTNLVAVPVHTVLRLAKTGRLRSARASREAWAQHAPHEHYLPLIQVRQVCADVLPGAQVRKHLLWRYSIVWRKTASERNSWRNR
jgi:ubiquinone/menaquinone biosynthesis C-methylase UbiE